MIPLNEALKLAVNHNREYQGEKELLYLQALNLTLVRHEFAPIFTAVGDAEVLQTQTPVVTTVKVVELIAEKKRAHFECVCSVGGKPVLVGEAVLMVPARPA